ncbi:hypothetical protein CDD81_4570 [Ophiocordyceps australis]|uniref:polynucleotide adenylyltransferase n=1 Tax=Ophiocordyceps australis TaxID=1399860 RepID=A0A2C5Y4S5_9HYPO|nr:hypothetical protein CDD81_4570 [Ophiocordyceps australis]
MSRRNEPPSRRGDDLYDSWRPLSNHHSHDSYRAGADSHRPSQPHRAYESYRPSGHSAPESRGRFSQQAYQQPQPPQSDFTFRLDYPHTSFTPINPRADRPGQGPRRSDRDRSRRLPIAHKRPRWKPPHPSERALISGDTYVQPSERLHENGAKFRNPDDLSDDDEVDMIISSSESASDKPPKKRVRIDANVDNDDAPKWSNPDPYTALPCPDETRRRKPDVVQLIRKARVEETKPVVETVPEAENFLSFDLSASEGEANESLPTTKSSLPGSHSRPPNLPPRPPVSEVLPTPVTKVNRPLAPDRSGPLGSRKRTADDVIKPPDYGRLNKAKMKPSKGTLVAQWEPKAGQDLCPWVLTDHASEANMAVRLHKEIVDFYEFVRPKKFEQRIRENLVQNLQKAMRRDPRFSSAKIHAFGSYMSGLYLPTADMDLVVCSASYMSGGPPTFLGARSWLHKFAQFLVVQKMSEKENVEVIARARVPLVKFVDTLTGLRVDVSFENLGGVQAIDTFLQWKADYPAMPALVTVVKHFLLMRGLNEPVNGGIGGFSVICLVVSMLQVLPHIQSRSAPSAHHLGELLLIFFELYGRHFRYDKVAISLRDPIGYVRKSEVLSLTYRNTDRLSIIDPNNASNDITGGASNTGAILSCFHDAFVALTERMREVAQQPGNGGILDVLLEGDYSSFRMQRRYLKHVYEGVFGPCRDE